jgi:hypothetical protein
MSRSARRSKAQSPREKPEPVLSMDDFEEPVVLEPEVKEVKEVKEELKNMWFIADYPLSKSLEKQLSKHYSNIQDWDRDEFANRSPSVMLSEFDIRKIEIINKCLICGIR